MSISEITDGGEYGVPTSSDTTDGAGEPGAELSLVFKVVSTVAASLSGLKSGTPRKMPSSMSSRWIMSVQAMELGGATGEAISRATTRWRDMTTMVFGPYQAGDLPHVSCLTRPLTRQHVRSNMQYGETMTMFHVSQKTLWMS